MALSSRRSRRNRAVAVGLALFLVSGALAFYPAGCARGQATVESASLTLTRPLVRATASLRAMALALWEPVAEGGRLREENQRLRAELAVLTLERAERERQMRRLGARLALDEFPQTVAVRCVAVPVHAIGPAPQSRTVVLGRGSAEGVRPNMAVLSPPGVAGVVRRVTERQSLVQLIVDSRSEWGATLGEDKLPGLLRGTGEWNSLQFVFESPLGDPQPGDVVYTSGVAGSLFPSGLPLGRVEAVRLDKRGRRVADVAPLAPLDALDEMFVVLAAPPEVDPAFRRGR